MLWSIFRLFRVASRAGGFNAFVSSLGFERVLRVFCSLWGILASAGLSPPLFPAKSVQDEDELVPRTLQSCHILHPVLIISLAGTLTGLS